MIFEELHLGDSTIDHLCVKIAKLHWNKVTRNELDDDDVMILETFFLLT